jgi:hypothetical protein
VQLLIVAQLRAGVRHADRAREYWMENVHDKWLVGYSNHRPYRKYYNQPASMYVERVQAVYWVETKGKTLEEIDAIFEGEKHSAVPDVEAIRKGEATVDLKELERDITMETLTKGEKSR